MRAALTALTCTVGESETDLKVTASGTNAQLLCGGFVNSSNGHRYATDQPDTDGTLMMTLEFKAIRRLEVIPKPRSQPHGGYQKAE